MVLSRSRLVALLLTVASTFAKNPSFSMEEGRASNSLVVDLSKVDLSNFTASPNPPNCTEKSCTYTLSDPQSTAAQYVAIDSRSGQIRTKQVFDREALVRTIGNPQFVVHFLVRDGSSWTFGSFVFRVGDINDNAPHFSDPVESLTISEASQPNAKHYISEAKDEDAAENGTLTYAIEWGNRNDTFRLEMDAATGIPYLTTSRSLDRESTPYYRLNISAHDNGKSIRLRGSHIVDVTLLDTNDNPPRFVASPYVVELKENSPSRSPLVQVSAVDPDAGQNGRIRYSLTDVFNKPELHFVIDNETGVIQTTADAFDYETEPQSFYEFFAKATDNPSDPKNSFTIDVTVRVDIVDVNDEPPQITLDKYPGTKQVGSNRWQVVEGYPKGTAIAQLSLADPDTGPAKGDYVDSYMTGGSPYFKYTKPQTIERLGEIIIDKDLDYEDKKEFNLTLVAVDEGVPPLTSTVSLTILLKDKNDNSPQFESASYSTSVLENRDGGVSLVQVNAVDVDRETNLIYGIDSVVPSSLRSAFYINATSGWIMTVTSLDREAAPVVRLKVFASDGIHVTRVNVSVTVHDVNDHRPQFEKASYEFVVPEGEAGATVGVVKATDQDQGLLGKVEYEMKDDDDVPFAVNRLSGLITTKGTLDRETHSSYRITIIARNEGDGVPMESKVNVTVIVDDENDNRPRFERKIFYIEVDKLTSKNKKVLTVSANDPDTGKGGIVAYNLIPVNQQELSYVWLSIDSDTGVVTVAHSLNGLKTGNYTFIVSAQDLGEKPGRSSVELVVHIAGVSKGDEEETGASQSDFGNTLIILIIALVVLVIILVLAALLFVFRRKARDWMLEKDTERGNGRGGGEVEVKAIRRKSSSRVQFAKQSELVKVNEYAKEPREGPEGMDVLDSKCHDEMVKREPKAAAAQATIVPRYSSSGRSRQPIQNEDTMVLEKDAGADGESNSSKSSRDSGLAGVDETSVATPSTSSMRELLPRGSASASTNGVLATPL